jgi:hypothetical protein
MSRSQIRLALAIAFELNYRNVCNRAIHAGALIFPASSGPFHYTDDVGEVIDEMFATEIALGMGFDHAPLANLPRMSEYSE